MPSQPRQTAAFTVAVLTAAGLAVAAMAVAAAPARAAEPADVYLRIVDAKASYSGRIAMSNGKVNIEGSIAHRPGMTRTHLGRTVIIHDHAREEWRQFLPEQKQYLQLSSKGMAMAVYLPPRVKRSDLKAETVGRETIGGEATKKIKLSFPSGELMVWQTPDGIVVKMEGSATVGGRKQTVTMTLTQLKRGAQDPALFLPPPGSKPLNAPPPRKSTPEKKK